LARAVYASAGAELSKYRGSKLDELRAALAEQDGEIIRLSRRQLRTKVFASAQPLHGNGFGRKSTWTELALIENEISKKQRFISVRDLANENRLCPVRAADAESAALLDNCETRPSPSMRSPATFEKASRLRGSSVSMDAAAPVALKAGCFH
jgi:hypothetical protein